MRTTAAPEIRSFHVIDADESHMDTVHLIHETNCYLSKPPYWRRLLLTFRVVRSAPCRRISSVWIAFPPFDPESSDYSTDATRLIGPVADAAAEAILRHLGSAFERAGIRTIVTHVADD